MPRRNNISNDARGLRESEHYNPGNGRVFVKAPAGFPGKRYIKDKAAPGGRYAYRYQVEAWRQTGRVVDGKKEVVDHATKPFDDRRFSREDDKNVRIMSRRQHYKSTGGRPFARPGGRDPRPGWRRM